MQSMRHRKNPRNCAGKRSWTNKMLKRFLGMFLTAAIFVGSIPMAHAEKQGSATSNSDEEKIRYRGKIWHNYALYCEKEKKARAEPTFDSRGRRIESPSITEAIYNRNLEHFFWDCMLAVSFPKEEPKGYNAGGAYFKSREKVKKLYEQVYGTSGETDRDHWLMMKVYKKSKPKVRVFFAMKKEKYVKDSGKLGAKNEPAYRYWYCGESISPVEDWEEKKANDTARELWIKGRKLMEENNYTEAIKRFEQAKEKAPNYSPPYYRLGLCYEKKGDTEKALKAYNKYLKLIEGQPKKEKIRNKVRQSIERLKLPETETTKEPKQTVPKRGTRKGIGVSYRLLTQHLSNIFTMKSATPVAGEDRYIGVTANKRVTLEIVGKKDNIISASLLFKLSDDRLTLGAEDAAIVRRFLGSTIPE